MSTITDPLSHAPSAADATPETPADERSPLTVEQLQAVSDAKQRRKKLDRAAGVAAFGGWSCAVLAALGLPFALFSPTSAVIVAGLGVIAYHEFKGRRLLKAADPRAPRLLGFNQVAFAAMIIAYSIWQIVSVLTGPGPYADMIAAEPMLANSLGSIEHLMTGIYLAVYATLIVGTILFQGGTAWYYFSRAKHLRAYTEQTPDWVQALLRSGAV